MIETSTRRTRELRLRRVANGVCINKESHGKATHGQRCQACHSKLSERRVNGGDYPRRSFDDTGWGQWRDQNHPGSRVPYCVNGHPFDEANTYFRKDRRNGTGRQCKACKNERTRRYDAEAKKAA